MKKLFVLCLLLGSFAASASQDSVLLAMKSMFQEGFYFGMNDDNEACTLQVQFLSDRAIVTARSATATVSRVIVDGSGYRFNSGRRELLSSDNAGTFRTLAVNEVMTYTVTAERMNDGSERAIECITNTVE